MVQVLTTCYVKIQFHTKERPICVHLVRQTLESMTAVGTLKH